MRYLLPLLLFLIALPIGAADRNALTSADLEQIIAFFARETANPRYYALDYALDRPYRAKTDTGEESEYILFNLIPSLKGVQGVGPTHYLNSVSGQIFRLYGVGCERYRSQRLDAFVKTRRARHPVSPDVLARAQAHYRALSDPFSTECLGDSEARDTRHLSFDEAEGLFRHAAADLGLLAHYGLWSALGDAPGEPYFRFDLERFAAPTASRSWRHFVLNAWTGDLYETRPGAPCQSIRPPGFSRRRTELIAAKGLSDADLAAHRVPTCSGDGLPP